MTWVVLECFLDNLDSTNSYNRKVSHAKNEKLIADANTSWLSGKGMNWNNESKCLKTNKEEQGAFVINGLAVGVFIQ